MKRILGITFIIINLFLASVACAAGSANSHTFTGKQMRGFWYAPESCSPIESAAYNAVSKRLWRCQKDDTLPQAVMMYYTFPDNCLTNDFTVKVRFSASASDPGKYACFYAAYEVARDGIDWDSVPQSTIDVEGQGGFVELTQSSLTEYELTLTGIEAFDVLYGDVCQGVTDCKSQMGVLYLERRRTPDCTNNSTAYVYINEVEISCNYF